MSERLDQLGGLPMFDAPRARKTDPPTSHAAADSMREGAETQRRMIVDALEYGPMTGDQLDAHYGWPHATANRRLPELRDAGLVVMMTETRETRSGRSARLWRLAA